MDTAETDKLFMREALKEAQKSLIDGNYGIGAVLVYDGEIIARSEGNAAVRKDPTAHAETQLIDQIKGTDYYRQDKLRKMTVYTTLETCPMCYGTLLIVKMG